MKGKFLSLLLLIPLQCLHSFNLILVEASDVSVNDEKCRVDEHNGECEILNPTPMDGNKGESEKEEPARDVDKLNIWKQRLDQLVKVGSSTNVIAGLVGSASIAMSAAVAAHVERERLLDMGKPENTEGEERGIEAVGVTRSDESSKLEAEETGAISIPTRSDQDENKISDKENRPTLYKSPFDVNDDVLTREGGRLISGSFGLVKSSLRLVGDSVRVVGDTTAGLTGSSIKVVGTAVKSFSGGFDALGDAVGGEGGSGTFDDGNVIDNTRSVAGKSVKLLGSVVRGLGDSIVMAGVATETVASSSAGVAEDAVRVLESAAKSLSTAFSPDHNKHYLVDEFMPPNEKEINEDETYLTFGVNNLQDSDVDVDNTANLTSTSFFDYICDYTYCFITQITLEETEGVQSMGPEILGVIFLLFMFSLQIIRHNNGNENVTTYHNGDHKETSRPLRYLNNRTNSFSQSTTLRRATLFFLYLLAWLYLSHVSLTRSRQIKRNAEAMGFRNAIHSSASSTSGFITESTLWLNLLLVQMWRVSFPVDSLSAESALAGYPIFVRRAIEKALKSSRFTLPSSAYGGLEPYISERVGNVLAETIKSSDDDRPSDVAYVSLDSFTLGSQPPLVRGISTKDTGFDKKTVQLRIDVDALLGDLSVVLAIKLSSLDRAILPSTKLAIHAVDVHLPLDVSISFQPEFPFISIMTISISEMPRLKVKITPESENSGLRGVDLGSLPVISSWIQDAIDTQLLEYVSPRYISINVPKLLDSDNPPAQCDRIELIPSKGVVSPLQQAKDGVAQTKTMASLPKMPKLRRNISNREGLQIVRQTAAPALDEETLSHRLHVMKGSQKRSKMQNIPPNVKSSHSSMNRSDVENKKIKSSELPDSRSHSPKEKTAAKKNNPLQRFGSALKTTGQALAPLIITAITASFLQIDLSNEPGKESK